MDVSFDIGVAINQKNMREVKVLRGIKHPHITGTMEVIDSPQNIIIIMILTVGGESSEQILKDSMEGNLKEEGAKI